MKTAFAFLLMLAVVPVHAQLLKCIGKDGKVEYAAQCPPGTKALQTGISNNPAAPSAAPQQKSLAERDAEFKKRQMDSADAQKKEQAKSAENTEKRENCERAKVYLKSVQEGQRIAQVDPKTGERVFLEDADRPAELARAQKSVDSNCN